MTGGAIKLDMYLAAPSEAAFAVLGKRLQAVLEENSIDLDRKFAAGFAAGHVCGITFATAPEGRYSYLATMVADSPELPAGYYDSLLVTSAKGGMSSPADFDPAQHRAVINETGSFSGNLSFAAYMQAAHGISLGNVMRSGAHLKSITMVASGEADLAAIDRISFSLARHAVPQDVEGVAVIGHTASHPGIAFVADASLPDPVVQKLRAAILEFRDEPAWAELQTILGVTDITVLDPQNYAPMASVAA